MPNGMVRPMRFRASMPRLHFAALSLALAAGPSENTCEGGGRYFLPPEHSSADPVGFLLRPICTCAKCEECCHRPLGEENVISGHYDISVVSSESFKANNTVKKIIRKSIAMTAGVPPSYVDVWLKEDPSSHLVRGVTGIDVTGRLLLPSKEVVRVYHRITIPPGAPNISASDIKVSISDPERLSAAYDAVQRLCGRTYFPSPPDPVKRSLHEKIAKLRLDLAAAERDLANAEMVAQATTITGEYDFEVANPDDFVQDTFVMDQLKSAISRTCGVPLKYVDVSLKRVDGRRLFESDMGRRLTPSGTVRSIHKVMIPKNPPAGIDAKAVQRAMQSDKLKSAFGEIQKDPDAIRYFPSTTLTTTMTETPYRPCHVEPKESISEEALGRHRTTRAGSKLGFATSGGAAVSGGVQVVGTAIPLAISGAGGATGTGLCSIMAGLMASAAAVWGSLFASGLALVGTSHVAGAAFAESCESIPFLGGICEKLGHPKSDDTKSRTEVPLFYIWGWLLPYTLISMLASVASVVSPVLMLNEVALKWFIPHHCMDFHAEHKLDNLKAMTPLLSDEASLALHPETYSQTVYKSCQNIKIIYHFMTITLGPIFLYLLADDVAKKVHAREDKTWWSWFATFAVMLESWMFAKLLCLMTVEMKMLEAFFAAKDKSGATYSQSLEYAINNFKVWIIPGHVVGVAVYLSLLVSWPEEMMRSATRAIPGEYESKQMEASEKQCKNYEKTLIRSVMIHNADLDLQTQFDSRGMPVPATIHDLVRSIEEFAEQENSEELDELLDLAKTRQELFDEFKIGVEEATQTKITHALYVLEALFPAEEDESETQRLVETDAVHGIELAEVERSEQLVQRDLEFITKLYGL